MDRPGEASMAALGTGSTCAWGGNWVCLLR